MGRNKNRQIGKLTFGDRLFDGFNILAMFFVLVITLYPFLYVLFASFSDPGQFVRNIGFIFYPRGFTLNAYKLVFKNQSLLIGYRNTFFYLASGLTINMVMTCLSAYVLSRKGYMFKRFFTLLIIFTMYFSGGLVPYYLLIRDLGFINSFFSLIIPPAINTFNMIVLRTAFSNVPVELEESARIDGANDFTILFNVIIPLSLASIMVIALYYAVEIWNSWFFASIFISKRELFPLQLVLREILVAANSTMKTDVSVNVDEDIFLKEIVKYATIIVSTVPILFVYPFIQKYFVKGVMIGAVKG